MTATVSRAVNLGAWPRSAALSGDRRIVGQVFVIDEPVTGDPPDLKRSVKFQFRKLWLGNGRRTSFTPDSDGDVGALS
jgi:hypothetical protein